jgi:hypothetical protein
LGEKDLSYRPTGVKILGTLMIIFGVISFIFGFFIVLPASLVYLFESTSTALLSQISTFLICGMLLAGAVGMLSMTGWGYYLALTCSIILIPDSVLALFFSFSLFIISPSSLALGIAALAYLLSKAKYEYLIES